MAGDQKETFTSPVLKCSFSDYFETEIRAYIKDRVDGKLCEVNKKLELKRAREEKAKEDRTLRLLCYRLRR